MVASSKSRNLRLSLDVDARTKLCRTHTKSIQPPLLDKSSNKMELLLVTTSSSPLRLNPVATLAACPTKMTCNHLCLPTACSSSRMATMTINSNHNTRSKCLPAKTHSFHPCLCPWVVLVPRSSKICNSEAKLLLNKSMAHYQTINRVRWWSLLDDSQLEEKARGEVFDKSLTGCSRPRRQKMTTHLRLD